MAVEVIYSASNRDETGPGASGQVQELQERSRTIRSITRMIRSSSRTTFTGGLVGFSGFKGGYKKQKNDLKNPFKSPLKPLKGPLKAPLTGRIHYFPRLYFRRLGSSAIVRGRRAAYYRGGRVVPMVMRWK